MIASYRKEVTCNHTNVDNHIDVDNPGNVANHGHVLCTHTYVLYHTHVVSHTDVANHTHVDAHRHVDNCCRAPHSRNSNSPSDHGSLPTRLRWERITLQPEQSNLRGWRVRSADQSFTIFHVRNTPPRRAIYGEIHKQPRK